MVNWKCTFEANGEMENWREVRISMLTKEVEKIYERIRAKIISGGYLPGSPLAETPLSMEYGINRTRIRQILQKLERESLVERFPYRGAFVKQITSKDLQEIFEMREAMESMAARLAARRRDDEDLRQIRGLFDKYKKSSADGDLKEKIEIGERFHQFIMRSSKNGKIIDTMQHLKLQIMRIWEVGFRIPDRIDKAFREHLEILTAIAEKNEDLAEQKMKGHISDAFRDYINATMLNETGNGNIPKRETQRKTGS